MTFELPDLPYSHDALAGNGMSKETLEYHHDIHHKAYVDNGNKAIKGTEWEGKSLEEIIKGTYDKNAVAQSGIFNNMSWRRRARTALAASTTSRRNLPLRALVSSARAGHGWSRIATAA